MQKGLASKEASYSNRASYSDRNPARTLTHGFTETS
jgi:hypothetical protein